MVCKKLNLNRKQIIVPLCDLRSYPTLNSPLETQLLYGEKIEILDSSNKQWIYCKSLEDDYPGWIKKTSIGEENKNNYRISNICSHVYEKPNIKSKIITKLFYNSKLLITDANDIWYKIKFKNKNCYIYGKHVSKIKQNNILNNDWVDIVIKFLNTVYLWGGKSEVGIDCSGLIQLVLQSCGFQFPRNTKDQYNSKILETINENELSKGALVFWKGHVAIAINNYEIIHANAHHMKVEIEQFITEKKRIENLYGKVIGIKKLKLGN